MNVLMLAESLRKQILFPPQNLGGELCASSKLSNSINTQQIEMKQQRMK
jgi:hypothetical protein